MTWFDIPTEHRSERYCASDGCGKEAVARFEAGGVGSDYCVECVTKIDAMVGVAQRLRFLERINPSGSSNQDGP